MSFLRKILVGVVSLTLIVAIYLIYSRFGKPPPIKIGSGVDIGDANIADFNGAGGKIGDARIARLKGPVYQHRNAEKEIDREFGFAELLRTVGDVWEVEKPWMKVYQRRFRFDISADKGTTELETIVGSSTPKDATFEGNVTIRILPIDEAEYKETNIYLDNLVFLSDKSQFSTPGPVKLVSQDIRMDGTGLEFVYNDRTQLLDYLRLTHLEELRIKGSAQALLSKYDSEPPSQPPGPKELQSTPKTDTGVTAPKLQTPADDPAKTTLVKTSSPPSSDLAKTDEAEYYKCILSENVIVDTPDEIVFARDQISLNNILWSKSLIADDANSLADANGPDAEKVPAVEIKAEGPKPNPPTEPNLTSEEIVEIVVTCDNGILLVPMNSTKTLANFARARADKASDPAYRPQAFDDPNGRSTFLTERIDYNSVSGDALAAGPAELVFYTASFMALEPNETSVPVTVTCTEAVHLLKEANQAVFNRDCLLTMPQADLIQPRDVTFSASRFTVNLPDDTSGLAKTPGDVVATGPVELIFYVEDSNAADTNEPPVPVKITAQRQARFVPDANQVIFDVNCLCTVQQPGLAQEQNFTLTSPRLIANLPRQTAKDAPDVPDVLALGPVELEFYVHAFDSNEPNTPPLPAKVTAAKHARFLPAENKVLFEGDCKTTVVRTEPNFVEEHILSAQHIVVDLPADSNQRPSESAMGIEHLSAYGGVVTLATKKSAGDLLLSGIELICRKFDYDPNAELFTAVGPGVIKLANAEKGDPNEAADKFSLNKPCWAIIQNYDSLTYFQQANRIIASAGSEGALVVQYFPIKDGEFTDHIVVTANHVEADLLETVLGDTELSTLTASGGVTYQAKDHEFIGGEIFYDHAKQLMKVIGSESFP
ncbi:MAG: hypothetical protein ISS79_06500, partial [Phycisphaerae bacterium]|nr:hypothetical protein [Phycisphaerae bacterium]